jgi:hypothetical protein
MVNHSQTRHYLKNKQEFQRLKRLSLWEVARQDTKNIIEMIVQKYQPKQIIQWGAL